MGLIMDLSNTSKWHVDNRCAWNVITFEHIGLLLDIKGSHPVKLDEYAISDNIQHKTEFVCWVPYTMNNPDRKFQR